MTGQQIYEWLKRHSGKLMCSWYETGVGTCMAPCRSAGEPSDSTQWVVIGGLA